MNKENNNELWYLELMSYTLPIMPRNAKEYVYFNSFEKLEDYKKMFYSSPKTEQEVLGYGKAWFNERGILVRDNMDIED